MRVHVLTVVVLAVVVAGCGGPNGPKVSGTITAVTSTGETLGIAFPTETTLYADAPTSPENELFGSCSIVPGAGGAGSSVSLHVERHYPFAVDPCSLTGINRLDVAHDDSGTTIRVEQCPSNGYGDAATCAAAAVTTTSTGTATVTLTHCTISGYGGATATVDGSISFSHCASM